MLYQIRGRTVQTDVKIEESVEAPNPQMRCE
ncbi:hypothetical protein ABH892_002067 [Paenibacillus sp. RC254]